MTPSQWLEVFASYSLQVYFVISVGRILERRTASAADRCFVWNACFVSILMLGISSLLAPRLHLFQPWLYVDPHALLTISSVQGIIGKVLLVVWCLGAGLLMTKWIARELWLRRMLRRCPQLSPDVVEQLLAGFTTPLNDRQLPTILISENGDGPYCWQLHRPTVLLPRFLLEGSREDLHYVLVHELEHLRTNHPLQLFLQNLVQVACWFHPAVRTAACNASLAREYTCDDMAAEHGANSAAYLRTLLRIAEYKCGRNKLLVAIGFSRTRSEIVLRAQRLVRLSKGKGKTCNRTLVGRKSAACILVLASCIMAQTWLPSDSMASSRSVWSPWPSWSANALHYFGLSVRDYEEYDRRVQPYELSESGRL